jgi:hypothetical protein
MNNVKHVLTHNRKESPGTTHGHPSASSFVKGFSVVLDTSRNLLAALMAHCAALLMGGDCIGDH